MLEVRDLHADYGPINALTGVDLCLRPGEVLAIVGANGAGKSTLLNTISGVVAPTSGDITLDGQSLRGLSPIAVVRRGIVQAPEGRQLFARLTVEENLRIGAQRRSLPWSVIKTEIDRISEIFPVLRSHRRDLAGRLSGGQQQMVALARAVLAKPRILLLDEPGLGLSPLMMDTVFGLIPTLLSDIESIVIAEQQADAALAIASRAYVISGGKVSQYDNRTA